jgi:hypothetical protein
MARYDDLKTGAIAYATFISTVLLLVIVLLLQALTYAWINGEEERKFGVARYTSSDDEILRQKSQVNEYRQVTVEVPPPADAVPSAEPVAPTTEKRLHIPVSQAESLLKAELGKSNTAPKT